MGDPKRKHEEEETPFDELPPIEYGAARDGASPEQEHEAPLHELPPIEYRAEEPQAPAQPMREQPWYDQALSFLHGATGHIGDEAAALASKLDPRNRDLSYDDLQHSYDAQAQQVRAAHPIAHGAGQAALGGAAAAVAGPAVGAQALAGGLVGAGSAYGDSHDAGDAALHGAIGAGAGAAGAYAGQLAGRAFGRAAPVVDNAPTVVDDGAMRAAMEAHAARPVDPNMLRAAAPPPVIPGRAALQGARPYAAGIDTGDVPTQALLGAPEAAAPAAAQQAAPAVAAPQASSWFNDALQKYGGLVQKLLPRGAREAMAIARGADGMASGRFAASRIPNVTARDATIGGLVGARAMMGSQTAKPSANQGVVSWAVQRVLGSGEEDHGLPPEDAQALNTALMSGDPQRLNSALYVFQDKHPEFAAMITKAFQTAAQEH